MKKYLKTVEDIEALRNTDTKIYKDGSTGYYKFVNGILCFFNTDSLYTFYNVTMDFNQVESKLYIEVEEEPNKSMIGKLGWFWWNGDKEPRIMDRLEEVDDEAFKGVDAGEWFDHFRLLTPEEVEKYTGYKVVEDK